MGEVDTFEAIPSQKFTALAYNGPRRALHPTFPTMTLPTCTRRLAAAAVLISIVTSLHGAPVAVNDSYSVSEDTLLATGGGSLVSANYESPGNVLAGTWSYLDKIKNNQNGQTPDTYPLDNA